MSQVAILEGNIGNGRTSSYAIYEHHSDARAWSITVTGKAEAKFSYFLPCYDYPGECIFETTEKPVIGINQVRNYGDIAGTIYIKFEELDADGNPLAGGVSCSGSATVDTDEYARLWFVEESDICKVLVSHESYYGTITLLPRSPGTYYFGMKTWAEGESEPPYPSPTAALSGAEVLPVAGEGEEGTGLAIPVTVVSGLALVGLGILQARSRRF